MKLARAWCLASAVLLASPAAAPASASREPVMPWREAGLDERQAAAHLVSRFTFGATPDLLNEVVGTGIERWFVEQLDGPPDPPELEGRLAELRYLDLPEEAYGETFLTATALVRLAQEEGLISSEISPRQLPEGMEKQKIRHQLVELAAARGYRSQQHLMIELYSQKLLRAVYAESQLHEVLTDFWFNHFNVARSERQSQPYLLAYERDAIRPFVTARFRELLGATARHPAMLFYLDNHQSTADEERQTTAQFRLQARARGRGALGARRERALEAMDERRQGRGAGLNENYARELLELHTLGVDGGYSQEDVIEVARAFTGWSALPGAMRMSEVDERLERAKRAGVGFVFDGSFVFRADQHDAEAKRVLGRRLPPGRGMEDGEDVLDLLAVHPSTAAHLSLKLARRFIADEPPPAAVDELAEAYRKSGGRLDAVLRRMVSLPEFWDPAYQGAKIKSPFELAASALRALDADVRRTANAIEWIERMGQPLYDYQAPTGFPDRASQWVNTGSLINRMNFGLALASGRIGGIRVHPDELLAGREPESRSAALEAYLDVLLPGGATESTIDLLLPMIEAPDLIARLDRATPERPASPPDDRLSALLEEDPDRNRSGQDLGPVVSDSTVAQVVGVILGSPDFQRR